jgi:hypothetical protein
MARLAGTVMDTTEVVSGLTFYYRQIVAAGACLGAALIFVFSRYLKLGPWHCKGNLMISKAA